MKKRKNILIADILKTFRLKKTMHFRQFLISFSREKLISKIEEKYKIKLLKKEKDNFPYFTDGGFKFLVKDKDWTYNITCHPYEII